MNNNEDLQKTIEKYSREMQQYIKANSSKTQSVNSVVRSDENNGEERQFNELFEKNDNEPVMNDMPTDSDRDSDNKKSGSPFIILDKMPSMEEIEKFIADNPSVEMQNPDNGEITVPGDSQENNVSNINQQNHGIPEATAFGTLMITASTANGAVPIEGAHVAISQTKEDGDKLLFSLVTDKSGHTPLVRLKTYPASFSQDPDFVGRPYKSYMVRTALDGYFTVINNNVPIFDGMVSNQPVNMIPLPQNFEGNTTVTYNEGQKRQNSESEE